MVNPDHSFTLSSTTPYPPSMDLFRILMYVLVVLHGILVAATAQATVFTDIGSPGERFLLIVVHPLAAVGLLMLVFTPRLPIAAVHSIVILLVVNVIANLVVAMLIALGYMEGGWELALLFAVVPAIGIVYRLTRSRSRAA